MIAILGAKRVAALAALVGLNVLMAALLYYYVLPKEKTVTNLQVASQGELATLEADMENIRNEFAQFDKQKEKFDMLQKTGFLSSQDRLDARRRFEDIRVFSKVLSARYTINPAVFENNESIQKSGNVVMVSPVNVELKALDDVDMYRFLYYLETYFPGHPGIDRIAFKRVTPVNQAVLRQIGSGLPVVLVDGTIDFSWRTIVPQAQVMSLKNGSN